MTKQTKRTNQQPVNIVTPAQRAWQITRAKFSYELLNKLLNFAMTNNIYNPQLLISSDGSGQIIGKTGLNNQYQWSRAFYSTEELFTMLEQTE
jgi:hypothetical protein